MHVLTDIGDSLRESLFMAWKTGWALVLGFTLSGVVQAFVPRSALERLLGDHRLGRIGIATALGAVSSSCSYAAAAMGKTLFARGADFVSSTVFVFASTNLVFDLGLTLWVLVGWQFALAEFAGGLLMIALFALLAPRLFRPAELAAARRRLVEDAAPSLDAPRGARRLGSLAGWSDAARYTVADLTMVRRELLAGYLVAGFLTVLVPNWIWRGVFISGHGFWTSLENAAVGPAVAIASFVCSVGNVALAAALWHGGIRFGGVVSFIFADLITLPLLLIYRRYYGLRVSLKLLALFWLVMAAAGLAVEEIFSRIGLVPVTRPALPASTHIRLDLTFWLNIVAVPILAGLWWLARQQHRLGGGAGLVLDPVCGMQIEIANAGARSSFEGRAVYFCSDHCRVRFEEAPQRYAERRSKGSVTPGHAHH